MDGTTFNTNWVLPYKFNAKVKHQFGSRAQFPKLVNVYLEMNTDFKYCLRRASVEERGTAEHYRRARGTETDWLYAIF